MMKQVAACCSSPAAMRYWFVISVAAWGSVEPHWNLLASRMARQLDSWPLAADCRSGGSFYERYTAVQRVGYLLRDFRPAVEPTSRVANQLRQPRVFRGAAHPAAAGAAMGSGGNRARCAVGSHQSDHGPTILAGR